jgi:peptidyl-prolyl cis-trans isomerase D
MKNVFASKVSYFILTFIFLIITASFLFSNFGKMGSGVGGKDVATVDGTPVSAREFQVALNRQVEFYNQMMGGKGLTQKQLEEMGIKQSVLNGLIQQKLISNVADSLGLVVSQDEIKNEIKQLPYFQRNNQFDVNQYRNVLQSNGYSPSQFEELIGGDLKQKKIDEFFSTTLVSENYAKDIVKFKANSVNVTAIKVSRQALAPLVSVSEQEIKDYVAKPENKANLETAYTENYAKYNQPEEVKARHILVNAEDPKAEEKINALKTKITTKNFAEIAKKETQDPSGKGNGGDLGWFAKGRMVPEFDAVAFKLKVGEISAPVKTQFGWHLIYLEDKKAAQTKPLESVKNELAQMAIQKTKAQDLDKLLKAEDERLTAALKSNDLISVDAFAKKVDAQLQKAVEVNQFDQTIGGNLLAPQEADQIFKAVPGTVVTFSNPGSIYLVKVNGKKTAEEAGDKLSEQIKSEQANQSQLFSRKVREELIKNLNNKAKIVTNGSML